MKSIFVSSTFSDMQAERDALMMHVLPELNAFAKEYGQIIKLVDLRWGIDTTDTDSESSSKKVLSVCLDEIDNSRPYMIVFIGERYGWIPTSDRLLDVTLHKKFTVDDLEKSVTELEIEYGALSRKANLDRCLFYFRDPLNREFIPEELKRTFFDEEINLERKLLQLKEKIVRAGGAIKKYSCSWDKQKNTIALPEKFDEMIISDVKKLMQRDLNKIECLNAFDKEFLYADLYAAQKSEAFSAKYKLMNHFMRGFSKEEYRFFVLRGAAGTGKSTIMARMYQTAKRFLKAETMFFACGNSTKSQSAMDLIRQINYKMETILGLETPGDNENINFNDYVLRFGNYAFMYKKLAKPNLYIFIDALDQMTKEKNSQSLLWLPNNLPSNVKIIVSMLDSFEMPKIYPLQKLSVVKTMECLEEKEYSIIIKKALKNLGKELSPELIEKVIRLKGAQNPLYLNMVIQNLSMLSSKDFGKIHTYGGNMLAINRFLSEKIENFPETSQGMCLEVLTEAANAISKNFCMETAALLAVSRRGLREKDLEVLINSLGITWSTLNFSMFFKYMRPLFIIRDDGRIDFVHRTIREGLLIGLDQSKYNTIILDYLKELDEEDDIKMSEISWHAYLKDDKKFLKHYLEAYDELSSKAISYIANDCYNIALKDEVWIGQFMSQAVEGEILPFLKFINREFYAEFDQSSGDAAVLLVVLKNISRKMFYEQRFWVDVYIRDEILNLFEIIGDTYVVLEEHKEAENIFNNILDMVLKYREKDTLNYVRFVYVETIYARIMKKVGACKQCRRLYDEAVGFYRESLKIITNVKEKCSHSYLTEGEVKPYGTTVVRKVLLYLYEEMAKVHMLTGDYYELNGDFKTANHHYEQAHEITTVLEECIGDLHSQKMNGLSILKLTDLKAKCGETFLPTLKYAALEMLYMSNEKDNPFLNFADREELENLEIPENLKNLAMMKLRLAFLNKNDGGVFGDESKLQESIAIFNQLEEALQTTQAKRNLALSYKLLADVEFSYGNIAEAYISCGICLTLQNALDNNENADVLEKIGDIYSTCKKWEEAFAYYEESLEIKEEYSYSQQEKRKLAILYEKIGDVQVAMNHQVEGNVWYSKGITLTEEIKKHHEKIGATHVESFSEFRIAKLYQKSGNFKMAEKHYVLCAEHAQKNFDRAIEESEGKNYSVGFGMNLVSTSRERLICCSNVCYQLKCMNQNHIALEFAKKSETFDYDELRLNQMFLGDFYNEDKDYDKAVSFYARVLDNLKVEEREMSELATQELWSVAICYERVGTMFKEIGEVETAIEYYKECIKYRESLSKILPKSHVLRELADAYKLLGNEQKANEITGKVKEIYKEASLPFVDTVELFGKTSNIFRMSIETIYEICYLTS